MATRAYFRAVLTALVAGLSCPVHAEVTFPPTVIYGSWDDLGGLIKFLSEHSDAVDRRLMAEHHRQMEEELAQLGRILSACSPRVPVQMQQTTSHEEQLTLREAAATAIIDSLIRRNWFLNDRLFMVMYSDGGTEVVQYQPGMSVHVLVPGSLVKGTGKPGSACSGRG